MNSEYNYKILIGKIVKFEFRDHFHYNKIPSIEEILKIDYIAEIIGIVEGESEKFLVISVWNSKLLEEIEKDVYSILKSTINTESIVELVPRKQVETKKMM